MASLLLLVGAKLVPVNIRGTWGREPSRVNLKRIFLGVLSGGPGRVLSTDVANGPLEKHIAISPVILGDFPATQGETTGGALGQTASEAVTEGLFPYIPCFHSPPDLTL